MGESKINPRALLAKTLPRFPPEGRECHAEIAATLMPKPHVHLLPEEQIRTGEGGQVQIADGHGNWSDLPDGHIAHRLGEPLDRELCDIDFGLKILWANVSVMRAGPGGVHMPAEATTTMVPLGIRLHMPALIDGMEASLPSNRSSIIVGG